MSFKANAKIVSESNSEELIGKAITVDDVVFPADFVVGESVAIADLGVGRNYAVHNGRRYCPGGYANHYEIDFDEKINNLFLNNSLDCDKIVGKLIIRTRQSGDSIRLKNRGCTKSLTKLYNESGIPVDERDLLPVICDNIGVVWIYKIGVAHRCAINDKTKKAYVINVSYEES